MLAWGRHAILQYLCNVYGQAQPHWYPREARQRARIDCYLHWHHANTRSCATYTFSKVLGPRMGMPSSERALQRAEGAVRAALDGLENVFLASTPFIFAEHPSIADLSAYEEVLSLHALAKWDLAGHRRVTAWMARMQQLPHHADVHAILEKLRARL